MQYPYHHAISISIGDSTTILLYLVEWSFIKYYRDDFVTNDPQSRNLIHTINNIRILHKKLPTIDRY